MGLICAVVLAIVSVFSCTSIMAQTTGAGTINGTISDANKAVIPNAVVTVTNTDTGIAHTIKTNSAGIYAAPFLQPGHYKVAAQQPASAKWKRQI